MRLLVRISLVLVGCILAGNAHADDVKLFNKVDSPSVAQESITPLMDHIFAPFHHSALLIFSRLDLFSFIDSMSKVTAKDIAMRNNWNERAASAMLISLATSGLLEKSSNDPTDSFQLSSLGRSFLLPSKPGNIYHYLDLFWDHSPETLLEKATISTEKENYMLKTGGGAPSEFFINAMQGQTSYAARVLTPLINFGTSKHVVDIGGGSGTFAIEACRNNPSIHCSVYDLPGVCPIAEKYINAANITNQAQAIPGNMFEDEAFPSADCYIFGNILHDWPDDVNINILKKAYNSLPPNGTIIILEMLIAEDIISTTRSAAGLNLVMVTNEQGRQYKASELLNMLNNIGFSEGEVISSPLTPYSIIVAKKDSFCDDKSLDEKESS